MAEYNKDRYLPETPAEERQRLQAAKLKTEAENLAAQLIDQGLDKCPESGVTISDITGSMDDYGLYDRAVFDAARNHPADLRLMLMITGTRLIEEKLAQRPKEEEERAIEWHERRERMRGIG